MSIHGFVCGPRIYRYHGWTFEDHAWHGPWPHRKDGELRARAGRVFWRVVDQWMKLPKSKRERCRVGGGCQSF